MPNGNNGFKTRSIITWKLSEVYLQKFKTNKCWALKSTLQSTRTSKASGTGIKIISATKSANLQKMSAPQAQGEHLVQSPIISSSSDSYSTPFESRFSIRGRASIRRLNVPHSPRHILNLQLQILEPVSCTGHSTFRFI